MLKFRPPQQGIDDPVEWISPHDPEWDNERQKRENDAAVAKALMDPRVGAEESKRIDDEVRAMHPIAVYFTGTTRFSLDAPTSDHEGNTVTVRDYLKGPATVFRIRSLDYGEYRRADKVDDGFETFARLGLVSIVHGNETHTPERDPDGGISKPWLDALDRANRKLLGWLGLAVLQLCQQGSVNASEGKP